ncbi:ferredoxin--NADP reductase [uncultured Paraglaciecola sp.]|mgnify:FL=1|uniref:ferredoxin--NADP reductase n=1 Tax=uncultured Paraglaciecola sp. TaxID=1765024 RepID=UPI00262CADC5|nr:ferredoxin--NADP reductase [uncultured Paraglaciecola sp.]
MAKWLDAKVVGRTDWNDHLFSLRFACEDFPRFKAGQFTKVGVEQGDKVLARPYSLVSGPDDKEIEIIAVPVEDGMLSPQLHKLQVGDPLKIMSPATGFLVLDEVPKSRDLWLMATGTGVGPFLSILATEQIWQTYENVVLVYGARFEHDLAYTKLIETYAEHHPDNFHFVPIVSRETITNGLHGRIPTLLKTQSIQQKVGLDIHPDNSQVMLCGNPAMIEDATQTLIELGLSKHLRRSPGHISLERYW